MNQYKGITPKQAAYLSKLIYKVKKPRYLQAKATLGLGTKTIMKLSKKEASALISELKEAGR